MANNGIFYRKLFKELLSNIFNNHVDNWDTYRYGVQPKRNFFTQLKKNTICGLQLCKYSLSSVGVLMDDHLLPFKYLFDTLADERDKALLLKLVAYRIFGPDKVLLPTNLNDFLNQVRALEYLEDRNDIVKVRFNDFRLYRMDLKKIGMPIDFYYSAYGVYIDFVVEQYRYRNQSLDLRVKDGDIVIDAGGCWGDTSLYFSNLVGVKGHVFTYEFIPSNLDILTKNINLNPDLSARITVVKQPVWDISDVKLNFEDNGPASKVSQSALARIDGVVKTLSIDDLVLQYNVKTVNFVKMDIEGAELWALRGALKTIKSFRPTLAVAIYHDARDFQTITEWIDGLNLGYKFFLKHATIHTEETILFATIA